MDKPFEKYLSKPIERMAFQILPTDRLKGIEGSSTVELYRGDAQAIPFKAHEAVLPGDWVVRLTPTDTYHCTDKVFRERNIIPKKLA